MPAVVQDVADGRVLMLAYMDAEALAATLATGEVHFHSRSRDRLWRKGETSGNVLRLVELASTATATRSSHRRPAARPATAAPGAASTCDGSAGRARRRQGFAWLETLWATIAARAAERPAGSYTTSLLDGGVDAVGRKVTEEATEVLHRGQGRRRRPRRRRTDRAADAARPLAGEAADLAVPRPRAARRARPCRRPTSSTSLRDRHR